MHRNKRRERWPQNPGQFIYDVAQPASNDGQSNQSGHVPNLSFDELRLCISKLS